MSYLSCTSALKESAASTTGCSRVDGTGNSLSLLDGGLDFRVVAVILFDAELGRRDGEVVEEEEDEDDDDPLVLIRLNESDLRFAVSVVVY